MIRRALLLLAALHSGRAQAQDEPADGTDLELPPDESAADPLSPYRMNFDVLAERTIGTASKPVAFNWRRTKLHLAGVGSFPFELNNFNSLRGGGMARFPSSGVVFEVGLSYVQVWDTPSSRSLAYTPYRQPGRPSRLELELTLAYPLAEGVVTAFPRFFPAAEMVFNVYPGLRYAIYPTGWGGMKPGQVVKAILGPRMTEIEVENLDEERLDAMQVDLGRYGLMLGFGNDLYFEQGVFVSPRLSMSIPLLAPASGTDLLVWADFTVAVGVAF